MFAVIGALYASSQMMLVAESSDDMMMFTSLQKAPDEKSENLSQSYLVAPRGKSEKLSQQKVNLFHSPPLFPSAGSGGALWVQKDFPDFRAHTYAGRRTDF